MGSGANHGGGDQKGTARNMVGQHYPDPAHSYT